MELKKAQEKHIKTAKKLAKKLKKEKVFLVEGKNLVDIAISNNLKPIYIFITEKFYKENPEFISAHQGYRDNFLITKEKILSSLSVLETHRDILGFFKFRDTHQFVKGKLPLIVALDNMQDPTNFGAILRSSLLLGVSKIITSEKNVSIYNPKVVRGSMGALFFIKVDEHKNLKNEIEKYKKKGYTIYIADSSKGFGLAGTEKKFPSIIVFGNESKGVSEEIKLLSNKWIRIETENYLNSLSVSTAVGIILYEFYKSNIF